MALFTAYFDESDTERAGVVAGCVFNVDQLPYLEGEWQALLGRYGLSHFHTKDYVHSQGEFVSWKANEPLRREFLQRLIGIIARRANISISIVADSREYNEYVRTPERTGILQKHLHDGFLSLPREDGRMG